MLLLGEAWLGLALAALALRLWPFARVISLLRPTLAPPHSGPPALIERIAWAVPAASRFTMWHSVCFHQAIAAQRMLTRRGVPAEAHYGVAKTEDGGRPAHVWVTVSGRVIVGGGVAGYATLASFRGQTRTENGG